MSIAIIDYTGNYISMEHLPISVIILIICNETTLVPDSLKAVLLHTIDKSFITNGGIYIYRVSSDLIRGHSLAQVYCEFPNSKIYTARSNLFIGIVPNFSMENINLPLPKPSNPVSRPNEVSKSPENLLFEEIYSEALDKFSKTFLLIPAIRAYKFKSLKAQLKNLVDGVIMSKARKCGKMVIDSESVVCAIFEDLEKQDIVKNAFGNVEYDDVKLENFFGPRKNSVFISGFRNKDSTGIQSASQYHPSPAYETSGGLDGSRSIRPHQQPSNRIQNPNQNISSSAMNRKDFPVYSNPHNTKLVERGELIPKLIPAKATENRDRYGGVTRDEPEKVLTTETTDGSNVDWQFHDTNISMLLIDELGKTEIMDSIDSCFKLFRLCNSTTRSYFDQKKIEVNRDDFGLRVKKAMKLSLDTFFIAESEVGHDQISSDIQNHLNIKLKKNE